MKRPFPRPRPAAPLAAGALLCALAFGAGAADAPKADARPEVKKIGAGAPGPVQAPHYGDTLFHFYQDRYFTAITTLMASQHFNRVEQHGDEAELLRGGMLLSYGLHQEAGAIFAKLLDDGAAPAVRDRAWFYLAKIRYQRGYDAEAEEALSHVADALPPALEEERGLLQANLLMARADYAAAAELLNKLAERKDASQYARYNLGVALIRSGDVKGGSEVLDKLGALTPLPDEELRALRDKANLALGYAALQDEKPETARAYLERVRLNGLQANKALLGYGWAALTLKKPNAALVPFVELMQRDASDSAVLEARIAVPYALAEMGAYGQSLDKYNEAIATYDAENRKLDESIAAIRAGKLVDGLLERNPGEEMGWFWNIEQLPDMPHANHLSQVLAQHEFQEAFKNYRDLRFLEKNLTEWQDKLGVFDDMLANRRKAYAERLPQVRARAGAIGLDAMQQRRDGLAAEFQRADVEGDGAAYANDAERDLQQRLARVQAALAALDPKSDDPEIVRARERATRVAGALQWRLAQALPGRAWDAKKNLGAVDEGIAQARARDAALAQAQRDEPARFDAFGRRIAALDPRVKALLPRVVALSREQQGLVQDIAAAELIHQKERLANYLMQARFAVAQLYDRANRPLRLNLPNAGGERGDRQ